MINWIIKLFLIFIFLGCSEIERTEIADKKSGGITVRAGDVVHVLPSDVITPDGTIELNVTQELGSDTKTVKVISGSGTLVRSSSNY